MKTLEELRKALALQLANAQEIQNKCTEEKREPTSEETIKLDEHLKESRSLGEEIKVRVAGAKSMKEFDDLKSALSEPLPPQSPAASITPITSNVKTMIEDDPQMGFKSLGEFALAAKDFQSGINHDDARIKYISSISGASAGQGSNLGLLLPPEHSDHIFETAFGEADSLLGMVDEYPIENESVSFPIVADEDRTLGVWGGVQAFWKGEGQQLTRSDMKIREVNLEPEALTVLTFATDKLMNNPIALNKWLNSAASDAINFKVGDGIINGLGGKQPKGILKSGALVTIPRAGAGTVADTDIDEMWARLPAASKKRARWLYNVDVEPALDGLEDGGGRPLLRDNMSLAGAPIRTLKGAPLIPIEYAESLGTQGDLILTDMLGGYIAAIKGTIRSAMSLHLRFDFNEVAFRWLFYMDGTTKLEQQMTPFKGTNKQSHFITLTDAA